MARRLLNLIIDRVDLVDRGANQRAAIVLAKRDVKKDSPSVGDVHVPVPMGDEREEYEKALLSSEDRNGLPDSSFAAVWTDEQGKKQRKLPYKTKSGAVDHGHLTAALGRLGETQGMPAHVKEEARHKLESASKEKEKRVNKKLLLKKLYDIFKEDGVESPDDVAKATLSPEHVKDLKAQHEQVGKMIASYGDGPHPDGHPVHALKAVHEQLGKMLEGCPDDESSESEGQQHPVGKGEKMDAEIQKKLDDMAAQNVALTKRLDEELEKRLNSEVVDILKSFKATPFNVDLSKEDNDVVRFVKMKKNDPAMFERTMEILRATDAQLEQSAFYNKSVGTSRTGTGSAYAQLEAKAAEYITKSATPMTKEQAFSQACLDNPGLVRKYRAEQQ